LFFRFRKGVVGDEYVVVVDVDRFCGRCVVEFFVVDFWVCFFEFVEEGILFWY